MQHQHIGVFDSGIGGITVLKALRKKAPSLRFTYLGDTAHVPYGTRSPAQIRRFSSQCVQTLKSQKIDALVVACNTASSIALDVIQQTAGQIPVTSVVPPGIAAASQAALEKQRQPGAARKVPVLILATRATIQSGAYQKGLTAFETIEQPCPLLVPMIEEGWIDHPILESTVEEYVSRHRERCASPGVALLACTHYPWIKALFSKHLPGWTVVDSADAVALAFEKTTLSALAGQTREDPKIEWIFTDPDAVPPFARTEIKAFSGDRAESSRF